MKKTDIKKLNIEELAEKAIDLKKELARLTLGKARSESKDTSVFSKTRKSIARLKTELNVRKV